MGKKSKGKGPKKAEEGPQDDGPDSPQDTTPSNGGAGSAGAAARPAFLRQLSIEVSRVEELGEPKVQLLPTPSRKEVEDLMEREMASSSRGAGRAGTFGRNLSLHIDRPRDSPCAPDETIEPAEILRTPTQKEVEDLLEAELRAMGITDLEATPSPAKLGPSPAKGQGKAGKSPVKAAPPAAVPKAAAPVTNGRSLAGLASAAAAAHAAQAAAHAAPPQPQPRTPPPAAKTNGAAAAPAHTSPAPALPKLHAPPTPPRAETAPAPPPVYEAKIAPGSRVYPLADLLAGGAWPEGIDPAHREEYLSDSEFRTALGMGKPEFRALKEWRRADLKKKVGLF